MPHMRHFRGTYTICSDWQTGAFYVSDYTAERWTLACQTAGHGQPRNRHGYPLRPFPAGIYNGDDVPEGVFVDWQHDDVRLAMFELRRRPVTEQPTHRSLAQAFGFQHHLHPYRAADCWARRVDRQQARGNQARDPQGADYRRWSNRRWSPEATAAVDAAPGNHRHFGVEIEFNYSGHYLASDQAAIAAESNAAGVRFVQRWANYGRDISVAGWQGTRDGTVNGGEIISDILVGDSASHDEVRDMLRRVRDHGGVTSRPGQSQGMHVHHDARDFTTADKLRLIDNLEAAQTAIMAFIHPGRFNSGWCYLTAASDFASARQAVQGRVARTERYRTFNFNHLAGRNARVEWRALGNTLNGRKVRAWVKVGQAFMAATKAGVTFAPGVTTEAMLDALRPYGVNTWTATTFQAQCDRRQLVAA